MSNRAPFSYDVAIKLGTLDIICYLGGEFFSTGAEDSYPHNHAEYELFYVTSGVCHYNLSGKTLLTPAGNFLLIHPNEYHFRESNPSSHFHFRFAVKAPTGKAAESNQVHIYNALCERLLQIRTLHIREPIFFTLMNQLNKELFETKPGYLGNIESLCSLILTEFLRVGVTLPEGLFPLSVPKSRDYDLTTIERFFSDHAVSKVKIEDLAALLRVSVRQVNRILHRMYGMSFTQKMTELRLWEVSRRLCSTQDPVTTISQDCGFNNYNYFYVCFREKFGMTPTEYRAQKSTVKNIKS